MTRTRSNVRFGWKPVVSLSNGMDAGTDEQEPIELGLRERGIGCASVIPAAFIGVFGLSDYSGPKGWGAPSLL